MKLDNLNILVTGGAGLIGSHIVDILLKEHGCSVRVLDALLPPTHQSKVKPSWVPNEVEFILGSTCNANDMKLALEGIDVVFHQAASSYLGTQKDSFRHVFDEAATGTCVMFDVIKDNTLPIKKIVVASSMAVYGCASYLKKDGSEYPRDSEEHKVFLDFFEVIEMDTAFYWYTLKASPGKSIHWMTWEEIEKYQLIETVDSTNTCY